MKQLIIAFSLLPLLISSCTQRHVWNGVYVYEADFGKNIAGDSVVIEYRLVVDKNNCLISIKGYQANEHIICTIQSKADEIIVLFKSYENGSISNSYDVEVYNPRDPMFVLKNNSRNILTQWGQIKPDDSMNTFARYFNKRK